MNRQHVHMAPGLPGDIDPVSGKRIVSGMRYDCDTIIRVDVVRAMRKYGLKFFRSSNGVILCPGDQNGAIPPDCLTVERMDQATGAPGRSSVPGTGAGSSDVRAGNTADRIPGVQRAQLQPSNDL